MLEQKGHRVLRINFCFGDFLLWGRAGGYNFRGKLESWEDYISVFFKREGVTDLILLGEQRTYQRIAISTAKRLGIQVVVTDNGYLRPDWITFELNGMSGDSIFPKDPESIRKLSKSLPEPDLKTRFRNSFFRFASFEFIYALSNFVFRALYPFYRADQMHHPIKVCLCVGINLLKPRLMASRLKNIEDDFIKKNLHYFVFPLQIEDDFQIRAYSGYPNQQTAIREVLSSFAKYAPTGTKLVIKQHPLDPCLVNWRKICIDACKEFGIEARILFINGGNLTEFLGKAKGVVTINSTVGISALLLGLPLKVLGSAIYDIEGLTYKGSLDSFWNNLPIPNIHLRDDFIKAMVGTIQIRGVYYNEPGLSNAVKEAVERLDRNLVNKPLC